MLFYDLSTDSLNTTLLKLCCAPSLPPSPFLFPWTGNKHGRTFIVYGQYSGGHVIHMVGGSLPMANAQVDMEYTW